MKTLGTGQAQKVQSVMAHLRRIEEKTGIHATPHMFRHYFALSRWEAGWNLFMIANALGHKSIRTTELYLQLPENSRLEASKEYFKTYGPLVDEME